MKNPILATSEFCGPCKFLKGEFKKFNINIEYKDSVKDVNYFIENKIKKIPTLVTPDGDLINGVESIMDYLKEEMVLDK
jgi:glutaredoxin-related protein